MLNYQKTYFDPARLEGFSSVASDGREDWARSEGNVPYVFSEEVVLALNIALATGRPLLVSGEPGCGKTSLARYASTALGRTFYRETVTSRTRSSDLLSSFDAVRRLGDAQVQGALLPMQAYVNPGSLWWAMDPATAIRRGIVETARVEAARDPGVGGGDGQQATLLIDELDKADPDVPNDLLESLDEGRFRVPETGDLIELRRTKLLVVLTTNGERTMPPAFVRRCVALELPAPTEAWLIDIARRRFDSVGLGTRDDLFASLARKTMEARDDARDSGSRPPGTSEYLDAVKACIDLLPQGRPLLDALIDATLRKRGVQRAAGE